MFLVSRKFHNSFGIDGTEVHGTPSQQMAQGRKGWEWFVTLQLTEYPVTGIESRKR